MFWGIKSIQAAPLILQRMVGGMPPAAWKKAQSSPQQGVRMPVNDGIQSGRVWSLMGGRRMQWF